MSFNVNLGHVGGAHLGAGRVAGAGCGSIFGLFFGIILIPLSFGLVYYGEARLVNHGVVFARTVMMSPEQAAATPGQLVKFKGQPEGEFARAERFDKLVIYWSKRVEEYESHRDSDGDVEYQWSTKDSEHTWANFSIGGITILPGKANPVGEQTVFAGVRRPGEKDFDPEQSDRSPQVGDQRLTIQVIATGPELIVLGEMGDKAVGGGSSFVLSSLGEAETEQALRLEYQLAYWLIKAGAVLALWFGILCFFGPLMAIVGWIPWLGSRISGALAFGALFVSLIVVGVATVAVKFFWVIVVLVILAIAVFTWRGIKSPRERPPRGAAVLPQVVLPPPPAGPPAAPPPPPPA
jgi:hypothetical protein